MNMLQIVLAWLVSWLDLAAGGFAAMTGAFRQRREIRLVEEDDGGFMLQRGGDRGDWAVIAGPLQIEDGAIVPQLPSRTRSLMRGANLEIVLRPRQFLVRPLELPAGAAAFLEGVVRTQIDRLTPWRSAEAAFGTTPPERLDGDRIVVNVVATTRARLAPFRQAMSKYDFDVLRVMTTLGGASQPSRVCVLTETLGAGRRVLRLRSRLAVGLVVAALAAAVAGAAELIVGSNLDAQRDELEHGMAQRRAELRARHSGAALDAIAALDEKKHAALPSVLALESLSQTLPDGTYLTDLHIEGGKLQIGGLTDDAPGLIRLIEQSRQFSHAAFFEPTTHAANEAGERFHIEAQIEPKWARTP